MKRALLICLLCSLQVFAAKQRSWHSGKLVSLTDTESSHPAMVLSGGVIANAARITYHATVQDGSTTYFGESTTGRKKRIPLFVENSTVQYVIEKDSLFLLGKDGKEMRFHLIKQRVD